jgi:hypothetical protein
MLRALWLFAFLLGLGLGSGARAHEVRPAYLELRQSGADTWDVLWMVPARGDLRLALYPRFPESCEPAAPDSGYTAGGVEGTS